jgi:hypothetical protein
MRVQTTHGDFEIEQVTWERNGGRACGACTLCCKLVPVAELKKAAGVRCEHQRASKGCAIYSSRPGSCRDWFCRWLQQTAETADMSRPDRAHFVLDPLPDFVRLTHKETGAQHDVAAVQVWIDPAFPAARDDPQLRAFMLRMARDHLMPTILRWNNRENTVVWAPMIDGADWREETGQVNPDVGWFGRLPESELPPL